MKIPDTLAAMALLGICAACSNPFSFGLGRVEIRLDEASVRAMLSDENRLLVPPD